MDTGRDAWWGTIQDSIRMGDVEWALVGMLSGGQFRKALRWGRM